MPSRIGASPIASPVPATARPSRALSTTPCAAGLHPPGSWGTRPRAPSSSACCGCSTDSRRPPSPSCSPGERFAPDPLTDAERTAIAEGSLADAPPHVAGDVPDWILPSLSHLFGDVLLDELRALARRAPLDIRINTLKRDRETALAGARASDAGGDAACPEWPAHSHRRGWSRSRPACGAGIPRRLVRDPGRGLPDRRRPDRRARRRDRGRSLRGRRRQDPRPRGDDAERGTAYRHRRRPAPARPDP